MMPDEFAGVFFLVLVIGGVIGWLAYHMGKMNAEEAAIWKEYKERQKDLHIRALAADVAAQAIEFHNKERHGGDECNSTK